MINIPRLIKQKEQQQDQQLKNNDHVQGQKQERGEVMNEEEKNNTLTRQCIKKLQQGRQKIQEIKSIQGECQILCNSLSSISTQQIHTQLYINKDECKKKIKTRLHNFIFNKILPNTQSKSLNKNKQSEYADSITQIRNTLNKYQQIHNKQVELFEKNKGQEMKKMKQKIEYVKKRRQLRQNQLIIKAYLFEDKLCQLINEQQNRYQRSFINAITLMQTLCDKFNINEQTLSQKLIQMQKQCRKNETVQIQRQQIQKIYESKILELQLEKPLEISYQIQYPKQQKSQPRYEISIQKDLQDSEDAEQREKEES